MKFRKLVIECGVIAAMLAVSVPTAVSVNAAESDQVLQTIVGQINIGGNESTSEVQETAEADEAASEWDNKLLVVVAENSSLNIRKEADTDSEIMGKIYRACGAEVLEKGDEWTKIKSADVEGYVKNEYCLFGEEAAVKAEEICDKKAVASVSGIRIRSEANTDSRILAVIDEGDKVKVAETEEEQNGWVAVEYDDTTAYISADYVDVQFDLKEAVSMETIRAEEAAKKAAEEAARKAAEEEAAAKKKASSEAASDSSSSGSSEKASQSESSSSQSSRTESSSSAGSDDVTLLAAIIQCEAGGEGYQGQLAVGAVVMNRVRSGSFPNSISGVVYQSGQFTPASSGKLARVLNSGNISGSCYQAANDALAGADNTGGCLYFHAGTSGSGTVIGNQIFY